MELEVVDGEGSFTPPLISGWQDHEALLATPERVKVTMADTTGSAMVSGSKMRRAALTTRAEGRATGTRREELVDALAQAMKQQQLQIAELKALNERQAQAIEKLLSERK
jgi:hypothetical protein